MILVLAHGCFDILHPGHHRYLEAARAMGDKLIVSCSADEYVRKIKPPPRPIQNEVDRAYQLRNLRFVDEVFISYSDTGVLAILGFRPNIFVRGIDYKNNGINEHEARACRDVGCEIRFTETAKLSSSDYARHLTTMSRL